MRRKLIAAVVFFSFIICTITGYFYFLSEQAYLQKSGDERIILINEINHLAETGDISNFHEKTALLEKNLREAGPITYSGHGKRFILMGAVCIIFLLSVSGYVYIKILRPFEKMQLFAEKIAEGNFDVPLEYQRSNYFGAFTWAFDSMRCEITKARACEKEAVDNNKTVIATLSHDIKTPIASIRAYAEGLEANLDSTPLKRAKYLKVLMKKCDEVSHLTDDLFMHSLSDLDKLKITLQKTEMCSFMKDIAEEISGEQNDVKFIYPCFSACVLTDRKRLMQITENLINNSRKYAKSRIDISIKREDGFVAIYFRDYGGGIPDEDMPFITDKFYRGKNAGNEQGSGLGLYIVKYIVEQMNGKIFLHNLKDGLEVKVLLPEIFEKL